MTKLTLVLIVVCAASLGLELLPNVRQELVQTIVRRLGRHDAAVRVVHAGVPCSALKGPAPVEERVARQLECLGAMEMGWIDASDRRTGSVGKADRRENGVWWGQLRYGRNGVLEGERQVAAQMGRGVDGVTTGEAARCDGQSARLSQTCGCEEIELAMDGGLPGRVAGVVIA